MAHDDIRAPQTAPEKERPPAGRMLLFGGVAAACIAGAGLGLWARPVESEQPGGVRPAPAPVAEAPAVDRRLHVVVDDAPAPVGEPLAVLPQAPARAAAPVAPEPLAAKRPPLGLMRVAAPVIAALALPERKAAPPALEAPKPRPVTVAKAAPEPKKPAVVRLAHAEHAQPARKAPPVKLAKAEPKHARPRAHELEVAEEAPPPKPRRALLALAHVIEKAAQRHARDDDEDNMRASRARDHARKPAVREVRVSKPAARPKAPPKVERYIPPLSTKGAGPIKVTNVTTRCASPDPGEALACGDPALSAAQRRLNRAYAEAVAAGVSPSTLERQQQRWLAARAAAAREAPWAVREVYQARIAELQDLTRDARGE
jgi:uncharacterized protein YecT (DUF1311 family)